MKYEQAKTLAWARAHERMDPTGIARFAGGRYNTLGAYSTALAQVCAENGVEYGPGQPTADATDYVRQPVCWFFENRTVRCAIAPEAIIMPPESDAS